ncbi:MAG: outer membrane beta-barrel protein [Ekhidna sp.]|nr:outer membrane beta-barrel protein [Ekhidna sp.]MBC6409368.1 outer membrane beta-barrel protein [Ekhidna sp.]
MKSSFYSLLVLVGLNTSAQFMEFGGGLGYMNYSGDLVRGYDFSTSTTGGTVFYRMNFSEIFTIRLGLTVGTIKGAETPIDAFAVQRNQSFNSNVIELSSVFEYHFLDFKTSDSPVNYSPYIMGGVGVISYDTPANENTGRYQLVLPVGVGFKYLIQKKYTIGIEAGARKTFFDYLDGISDKDQTIKDYQYGNPKDDDWYFFTGLTFSITLFNVPCPFPYRPNQSILAR